jgi:hypothetical protein
MQTKKIEFFTPFTREQCSVNHMIDPIPFPDYPLILSHFFFPLFPLPATPFHHSVVVKVSYLRREICDGIANLETFSGKTYRQCA